MRIAYKALYGKNDAQIDIYEEDGIYYMTAEDIGKCLGYSQPRKQILNYFGKHSDLDDPSMTKFCRLPDKKTRAIRLFSEIGICRIARMIGQREFCEWITTICKDLRSGILAMIPADDSEQIIEQSTSAKKTSPRKTDNVRLLNCQRAQLLCDLAGAMGTAAEEKENLLNASMALLLSNNFDKVRVKYLSKYEDLI